MQALILLLVLIPAPKIEPVAEPQPIHPIVGEWNATWAGVLWQVEFKSNGTCEAVGYGKGIWWTEADVIYFTDNSGRWAIQIADWLNMAGDGARSTDTGYCGFADVQLKRR